VENRCTSKGKESRTIDPYYLTSHGASTKSRSRVLRSRIFPSRTSRRGLVRSWRGCASLDLHARHRLSLPTELHSCTLPCTLINVNPRNLTRCTSAVAKSDAIDFSVIAQPQPVTSGNNLQAASGEVNPRAAHALHPSALSHFITKAIHRPLPLSVCISSL
jgi:hypothetical protein